MSDKEREALEQQKAFHAAKRSRIYGSDRRVWAESRVGSSEYWNLYRQGHGVRQSKRIRIGELLTRDKSVIRTVLDTLAPFAQDDALGLPTT